MESHSSWPFELTTAATQHPLLRNQPTCDWFPISCTFMTQLRRDRSPGKMEGSHRQLTSQLRCLSPRRQNDWPEGLRKRQSNLGAPTPSTRRSFLSHLTWSESPLTMRTMGPPEEKDPGFAISCHGEATNERFLGGG